MRLLRIFIYVIYKRYEFFNLLILTNLKFGIQTGVITFELLPINFEWILRVRGISWPCMGQRSLRQRLLEFLRRLARLEAKGFVCRRRTLGIEYRKWRPLWVIALGKILQGSLQALILSWSKKDLWRSCRGKRQFEVHQ